MAGTLHHAFCIVARRFASAMSGSGRLSRLALLLNFGPECWRILAHPPPLNLRFVRLSRRNRSGLEIQGGIVRAAST